MEMYLQRMKNEWLALLDQTDPQIRQQAADIAVAHAQALSVEFYRVVLADPHAEEFSAMSRLRNSLKRR